MEDGYISDDVIWIMDLVHMQLEVLEKDLNNRQIKRETFDKYSYSSWAIKEFLDGIGVVSYKTNLYTVREILINQMQQYLSYYDKDKEYTKKYVYAADMLESLIKIVGGCIHDEWIN